VKAEENADGDLELDLKAEKKALQTDDNVIARYVLPESAILRLKVESMRCKPAEAFQRSTRRATSSLHPLLRLCHFLGICFRSNQPLIGMPGHFPSFPNLQFAICI
jgi:hypothetical protein